MQKKNRQIFSLDSQKSIFSKNIPNKVVTLLAATFYRSGNNRDVTRHRKLRWFFSQAASARVAHGLKAASSAWQQKKSPINHDFVRGATAFFFLQFETATGFSLFAVLVTLYWYFKNQRGLESILGCIEFRFSLLHSVES